MKLFTSLMMITIISVTNAQSEGSPCQEDRAVTSAAVVLWLNNYNHMREQMGLVGSSGTQSINISIDTLENFINLNTCEFISCSTVNFWYYYDSSYGLQSAISTNGDSTRLLIYDYDLGSWTQTDYSYLKPSINAWKTLTDDYTHGSTHPLIYIKSYSFNAATIQGIINSSRESKIGNLSIQNVMYTVSPDSERYDFSYKDNYETTEGYVAVDILLMPVNTKPGETTEYFNFAMPCPKNCPEKCSGK